MTAHLWFQGPRLGHRNTVIRKHHLLTATRRVWLGEILVLSGAILRSVRRLTRSGTSERATNGQTLKGSGVWDEGRVREADAVRDEARRDGATVHFGRVAVLLHLKGGELEEGHVDRTYRGGRSSLATWSNIKTLIAQYLATWDPPLQVSKHLGPLMPYRAFPATASNKATLTRRTAHRFWEEILPGSIYPGTVGPLRGMGHFQTR